MKKIFILAMMVVFIGSVVLAFAQEKEKKAKLDPEVELNKSIERGFALFKDKKLGTNEKTCNDCHMGGGTKDGKMGGMTLKAFDNLAAKYPKFFMMGNKVMTLDQVVNYCVTTPLKGEPLSWDDQRLTDLVAYCASLKIAKPKKAETEK